MGLFSKKAPCPICGGKISIFLPAKVDGEHICDECSLKIDMQSELRSSLTMQGFKDYLQFYESNLPLRESFVVSEKIDFGMLDTKMIFDFENKLFCMNKNPSKTVFEGANLKSFTIKEDNALLFEGSHDGLKLYTSSVPERIVALAPQIAQFMMNKKLVEAIDKLDDDNKNNSYHNSIDIPEPFRSFNVELTLEHPYWKVIKCDMSGPTFSSSYPDTNDYMNDYRSNIEVVERLARAFMEVSFPGTGEINVNAAMAGYQNAAPAMHQQNTQPTDSVEEIKKFKALMEEGIITREEFDAKKKQLLGI